jgi:hypothetical protein
MHYFNMRNIAKMRSKTLFKRQDKEPVAEVEKPVFSREELAM